LLSMAQQKCGDIQLPGLTHWLVMLILPALDAMHSRTLKRRIKEMMIEQAKTVIRNCWRYCRFIELRLFRPDQFSSGMEPVSNERIKIVGFRKNSRIDQESIRFGFAIAKRSPTAASC